MKQEQSPPLETERTNDEFVEQSQHRVQQMLNAGLPQKEILTRLAMAGEVLAGHGAAVSILLLDEEGLLRNGASPNLPLDYLQAIDRLKPDAMVGTCAAAAATAGFPRRRQMGGASSSSALIRLRWRVEHADQVFGWRGPRHLRHLFS